MKSFYLFFILSAASVLMVSCSSALPPVNPSPSPLIVGVITWEPDGPTTDEGGLVQISDANNVPVVDAGVTLYYKPTAMPFTYTHSVNGSVTYSFSPGSEGITQGDVAYYSPSGPLQFETGDAITVTDTQPPYTQSTIGPGSLISPLTVPYVAPVGDNNFQIDLVSWSHINGGSNISSFASESQVSMVF
jgi:hypothetical protein